MSVKNTGQEPVPVDYGDSCIAKAAGAGGLPWAMFLPAVTGWSQPRKRKNTLFTQIFSTVRNMFAGLCLKTPPLLSGRISGVFQRRWIGLWCHLQISLRATEAMTEGAVVFFILDVLVMNPEEPP